MRTETSLSKSILPSGVATLPHLAVIQAQGEDAANFLHNQLTNDVLLLPVGQSRLAAFCSAKGRIQASFVVIKTAPDTVLLVMNLDLLAQTLKRLSMFVLRAKVKLSDATSQWQMLGRRRASATCPVACPFFADPAFRPRGTARNLAVVRRHEWRNAGQQALVRDLCAANAEL